MIADLQYIISNPLLILIGAIIIFIVKAGLASVASFVLGLSARAALIAGLALAQVGEFSFILSKVGLKFDLIDPEIYQLFIAVSIFTMAATPFVIAVSPKLSDKICGIGFLKNLRSVSYGDLSKPPEKLSDHLVIIGFGLNGRNLAKAARMAGIPYTILEMNPDTVERERKSGEPIFYGDAVSKEVLRQTGIEKARVMVVAISDPTAVRQITYLARQLNPSMHLIVRTRFVTEVRALFELGADDVIPEEFETSIEIFTRVMNRFMVPVDQIEQFISSVRQNSYQMFRSLPRRTSELSDLKVRFSNLEVCSIKVDEDSLLAGYTLAELNLRTRYGVTVLAIERGDQKISNPDGNRMIEAEDVVHLLGDSSSLRDFRIKLKQEDVSE
jgi:CPA2 family monovalent cation:H+ antiporter-2